MQNIKIGNKHIGMNEPPFFIADIAANHDGDLNRAYHLIELAKDAGADAAKFQNFKAPTIVSKKGFDVMNHQLSHQKDWKKSVFDVYADASLKDEWSPLLKAKCEEVGIEYMTSPYDFASVELADLYSSCFKVGSGDITWTDILKLIAGKNKPVLLATGASDFIDVKRAVELIYEKNQQLVLMQCNTNYTVEKNNFHYINLNVLNTYKKHFPELILGLSSHIYGHSEVLGAIAMGARVIEKHFTDDNDRMGPDHKFSMNPKSWRAMVEEGRNLYYALGDGVKRVEENEKETIIVQRRGLYYQRDMKQGATIKKEDIFPLRPCKEQDIPPYEQHKLIGMTLKHDVTADSAASWEDIQ